MGGCHPAHLEQDTSGKDVSLCEQTCLLGRNLWQQQRCLLVLFLNGQHVLQQEINEMLQAICSTSNVDESLTYSFSQHVILWSVCLGRLAGAARETHMAWNWVELQQVLLGSPCVRLVLSGHDHIGGYAQHDHVHFVTVEAMLEGKPMHMPTCHCAQSYETCVSIQMSSKALPHRSMKQW